MAKTKNHLPKRIAGVKVPKSIRRGVVGELLTSVAGQAVIAALVLKAAARLRDEATHGGPRSAGQRSAHASTASGDGEQSTVHARYEADGAARAATLNVKHALAEAARHFILGLSQPKSAKKRRRASDPARGPDQGRPNDRADGDDIAEGRAGPDKLAGHPY